MWNEIIAFIVAASALLGSPGPGITALVAVGKSFTKAAALRFYGAMQCGLAIAAGLGAVGLAGILRTSPGLQTALMILATAYLLWLAYRIATAPVDRGAIGGRETDVLTNRGAFLLGVANPKAYLAFASLLGSFTLLPPQSGMADNLLKWSLCVAVMVVADLAWLALGMIFGKIPLSPAAERVFNLLMGMAILAACLASWA